MSSKVAKRNAEIEGGEKAKQRPLRRKIRDTTRLLSREQLPETVRMTQERVLKSLKQELAEKLDQKRSKKLSKKYRMVKFFEKRKVTRMLKTKIKLYVDCSPEDRVEMEEGISRLRMELNFIGHYPDSLKYQSLYPSTETTSEKSIARRESTLLSIAERVSGGELADLSLEFCVATPLERRGIAGGVRLVEESVARGKVTPGKRPRKTAPVDEEPDSDLEINSGTKLSSDDFFLDTAGNSDFFLQEQ